jgi:hypothetical protein
VRHPQLITMKQNKYPRNYGAQNSALTISQKWWLTVLKIEISCSSMGRLSMHAWTIQFFSFWRGGGNKNFFVVFPCSQGVLRCPKMFPIAPEFYPIWFAQSSTPMYIIYKGEIQECTFVSILQLGVQRGASIGGMPNVSQKSGMIFFHFLAFLMCSHQVLDEHKYFQQMNFKAFACLFYLLLGF